jgi:hypothetical protein
LVRIHVIDESFARHRTLTASAGKLLSRYVELKRRLLNAGVNATGVPKETPPFVVFAIRCCP